MKYAIITGGNGSIGLSISKRLIENGYFVFILDRNIDTYIDSENICIIKCDISIIKDIERAFNIIKECTEHINVLINAAAIQYIEEWEEADFSNWSEVININLNGTFLICKIFSEILREGGSIINISSIYSESIRLNKFSYDVSKSGINTLSKQLALIFGSKNIRVNIIEPGFILTNLNRKENIGIINKKIPLNRVGLPEDISNVVEFLISEKASYIHGTTIKVDGGRSLLK